MRVQFLTLFLGIFIRREKLKIRNGFVSNSSSSSFVLQLEKPIEEYTYEELAAYIYAEHCDPIRQIYNALKNCNFVNNNQYEIELGSDCLSSEAEYLLGDEGVIPCRDGIVIDTESFH